MHKERRSADAKTRDTILWTYSTKIVPHPHPATTRFVNAVPPEEHVATFRWLFDGLDLNESKNLERLCCLAVLEEAAGQRDEALANYRFVRSQLMGQNGTLRDAAEMGIKRLSRGQ